MKVCRILLKSGFNLPKCKHAHTTHYQKEYVIYMGRQVHAWYHDSRIFLCVSQVVMFKAYAPQLHYENNAAREKGTQSTSYHQITTLEQ